MSEKKKSKQKSMLHYAQYEQGDWYDQFIEDPLKDLVKVLRNNGINTECSCGHEMYIQCQHILDGELMDINKMLLCYLDENNLPQDYKIEITHEVMDGHQFTNLDIKLPNKKKLKKAMLKIETDFTRTK